MGGTHTNSLSHLSHVMWLLLCAFFSFFFYLFFPWEVEHPSWLCSKCPVTSPMIHLQLSASWPTLWKLPLPSSRTLPKSNHCRKASWATRETRDLEVNPPASCHLRLSLEAICMLLERSRGITAVTSVTFLLPTSPFSLSYPFHVYFWQIPPNPLPFPTTTLRRATSLCLLLKTKYKEIKWNSQNIDI